MNRKFIAFFMAICLVIQPLAAFATFADEGEDIIHQGDMEYFDDDGIPYYWAGDNATVAADSTVAHGGTYSLKVSERTDATSGARNYCESPEAGTNYTITAYIYATETDTFTAMLRSGCWEDCGVTVTKKCTAGEWTELTAIVTCDKWDIGDFIVYSENSAADFYLDDVSVTEYTGEMPTVEPTEEPTATPMVEPTAEPTAEPTVEPTEEPTTEPADEKEDIILYGDMESIDDDSIPYYWTGDNAAVIADSTVAHGGTYSLKVSERTDATSGARNYCESPEAGTNYTITAYIYATETDTFTAMLRSGYWEDCGVTVTKECTAGEWTELTAIVTCDKWDSGDFIVYSENSAADFYLDDVSITEYTGEMPTVEPTTEPTEEPTADPTANPYPMTVDGKTIYMDYTIFGDDDFIIYDDDNAEGIITSMGDYLEVNYGENHTYEKTNGIKKDITSLVEGHSGETFTASVDILSWYWGDDSADFASLFIEVILGDKTTTYSLASSKSGYTVGEYSTMNGENRIYFTKSAKVYLCVNCYSGSQMYKNISLTSANDKEDDDSDYINLTSGRTFSGNYYPAVGKAVYTDTFDSDDDAANLEKYTAYANPFSEDEPPAISGYMGAQFTFDEIKSNNTVALDITDVLDEYIPNGGTIGVSFDFATWYWSSGVQAVIVTGNKKYTLVSEGDSSYATSEFINMSGWADITRSKGSTATLYISHNFSTYFLDNVSICIPYTSVTVGDVAVSNWDELNDIETVELDFDGYTEEAYVTWDTPSEDDNVVYGTVSGYTDVYARAVRTETAVMVTVTDTGITIEEWELGDIASADGDELCFIVDSIENMNIISNISASGSFAEAAEGTTDTTLAIKLTAAGSGMDIEGIFSEYSGNSAIAAVKNAEGEIVEVVYLTVAEDGSYAAHLNTETNENYTVQLANSTYSIAYVENDEPTPTPTVEPTATPTATTTSSSSGSSSHGGASAVSSSGSSGTVSLPSYTANAVTIQTQISTETASTDVYNDIADCEWARESIEKLSKKGIINGYEDGSFRPNDAVTREAFVKMLISALGLNSTNAVCDFSDVQADRWSYSYIATAYSYGIVNGISEDSFGPEITITRQDAAVMTYRALSLMGRELSDSELAFTDGDDVADYAKEAVAALNENNIITGMGNGEFAPLNTTTRAEAAVIISRIID